MVVSIVAYLLEVVVFAGYAQAFLRIGHTLVADRRVAEEKILELVHPRVGEHQRRVVLYDHRGRRHDQVFLALEKFEKCRSDLIRIHN